MTTTNPPQNDTELRANALRAANGKTLARRGVRLGWLWEWAKIFPLAVVLFLVLRTFVVEAYKIPSASMEHTLLVGDFLLVNKLVYGAEIPFSGARLPSIRAPQHGDVIVFEYPVDPSKNFVKRLMGLPGDTVAMREGHFERNGQTLGEQYVVHVEPNVDPIAEDFRWQRAHRLASHGVDQTVSRDTTYRPSRNNWGPLLVPPHHYFVLGDNRDNSLDSRYWGFVPDSALRGTPMFVYYSFVPDSASGFAWLTRIRWARLGAVVR